MGKLWGGRFSKKNMDPRVMEFTSSLDVDWVLAKYDCLSSKVHVEMLSKCGFISREEKNALVSVLDELSGKIEKGELSHDAMVRELKEETGLTIKEPEHFASLLDDGATYVVDFYRGVLPILKARSMEAEQVFVAPVADLMKPPYKDWVIPNLKWLIPMALDNHIDRATIVDKYPGGK